MSSTQTEQFVTSDKAVKNLMLDIEFAGGGNEAANSKKMPCILVMFDFDQCYPKRCSGRKLCRLGFIRQQKIGQRFPGILLTPTTATSTLSP
uniref:RNase L inhibitor RLI-like possible metal-binding domain-containing protein n=1 Tax=Meloidogyne incognita TaxID=6306 RepID=A0A914ME34_MELIC